VELKPQYKGQVTYDGHLFQYKDIKFTVEDFTYFCNKSWSISYDPIQKNFISFHSYTPNYYVNNTGYTSLGFNYTLDENTEESGSLWYAGLTNKSYQVFQGKLQPYIYEFSIPSKYQNRVLNDVSYLAQFYRMEENNSSALIPNTTYNKAIVYNSDHTSGLLELVPQIENSRRQFLIYPIQNISSRSILVNELKGIYHFNNFFDVSRVNQ